MSPELQRIHTLVCELLELIAGWLSLTYLVLDGHFGNSAAFHMVQQCGLQLISKLRSDAALYEPYHGPYQGRDARRTDPHCSVLDLKAYCRGYTYRLETIKLLPEPPDEHIMAHLLRQVASLGRIHPADPHLNAA